MVDSKSIEPARFWSGNSGIFNARIRFIKITQLKGAAMRKSFHLAGLLVASLAASMAYAAKPVKIMPSNSGDLNGEKFRNYVVECSNGKNQPLTAWDDGKRWCIGKDSQNGCVKKQIKAAKGACKLD
jgi:hypothetical protein